MCETYNPAPPICNTPPPPTTDLCVVKPSHMQTAIKALVLTFTSCIIAATAIAQKPPSVFKGDTEPPFMPDKREKIAVGLKAGANYSGVYQARGTEFDPKGKFGLAAGAFVGIPFNYLFGVQPEVLYSQKGFSATGRVYGALYDITRTTSYIDVPVFLAIKPSKYVTILAGPQFSWLLEQKDKFTYPLVGVEPLHSTMNGNIRKNMVALAAGADLTSTHMVLGLRGGIDLQHNSASAATATPRYKNKWVQLTIGYKF